MLTTLNNFPYSLDVFFQGICAGKNIRMFDNLLIDYTQEEARLISKMNKTNDEENHALGAHARK